MIGSRMRKGDGMMRVIDIDDKGNVIIEKTSDIGKTEEIILTAEDASGIQEIREWARTFQEIFQKAMKTITFFFREFEDIIKILKRVLKVRTEKIKRETMRDQREQGNRARKQMWQQAKSTLKYKRYELRIYR